MSRNWDLYLCFLWFLCDLQASPCLKGQLKPLPAWPASPRSRKYMSQRPAFFQVFFHLGKFNARIAWSRRSKNIPWLCRTKKYIVVFNAQRPMRWQAFSRSWRWRLGFSSTPIRKSQRHNTTSSLSSITMVASKLDRTALVSEQTTFLKKSSSWVNRISDAMFLTCVASMFDKWAGFACCRCRFPSISDMMRFGTSDGLFSMINSRKAASCALSVSSFSSWNVLSQRLASSIARLVGLEAEDP